MNNLTIIKAGYFYSDAGASLGNLPRALWGRFLPIDKKKHRIRLDINLLLIETQGRVILVDTGLGNKLTPKEKEIFSPNVKKFSKILSEAGFNNEDITDVIMTHLHHDHAGGIVTLSKSRQEYLTFPNAVYHIQSKEWEIAREPDMVNAAAYDFKRNLKLLEQEGRINMIDGDYTLCKGVHLKLVGGHTEGMQIVIINYKDFKCIYAGDIIPSKTFLKLPITSAYDVCRKDTVNAKCWIFNQMLREGYTLIFDHETRDIFYDLPYREDDLIDSCD